MSDGYGEEFDINIHSNPKDVIKILKLCTKALNHEDESYIPAIRFAIRYMEHCLGSDIDVDTGEAEL